MEKRFAIAHVAEVLPTREATLNGRAYVVVPMISLVEGVHNGLLYPANEIAKFPEAWNGRPLPILHPTDESGMPISANSPQLIEQQSAGQIFNTVVDSAGKLHHEAWIDVLRAEQLSPGLIASIRGGEKLEVSTGLWMDFDGVAGEWNGERYQSTVSNFRPDHVALLPGMIGACSWADGCGIRANGVEVNVLSTARTPEFSGTETTSWATVATTFAAYRDGYYRKHGPAPAQMPMRVQDCPQTMRDWMASKSLLGDPNATSVRDLMFFPVVNPRTDNLNAGALRAVLGGRGAQANIPAAALRSAQEKARSLLSKHFQANAGTDGAVANAEGAVSFLVTSDSGQWDITYAPGNSATSMPWKAGVVKAPIPDFPPVILSTKDRVGILRALKSQGLRALEMSFEDIRSELRCHIDAMDNSMWVHFIRAVFADHFVYMAVHTTPTGASEEHLYQLDYSVAADGTVTIGTNPTEVEEQTTYVPVSGAPEVNVNKEVQLNTDKKTKIDALIACNCTRFAEDDRAWLATLSDAQLDKLRAMDPPSPPANVADYVNAAPAPIRGELQRLMANETAAKQKRVDTLLANSRNKFTKEQLAGKSLDELTTLVELAGGNPNYAGNGGAAPDTNAQDKVPPAPKVFADKKAA